MAFEPGQVIAWDGPCCIVFQWMTTAQLYIGAATSNPSMQNGTEVGIDWMEKVKVLNLKNLNI